MTALPLDPAHWQQRAREAREFAKAIDDPAVRENILKIAEGYDWLAAHEVARRKVDGGDTCAVAHGGDPEA